MSVDFSQAVHARNGAWALCRGYSPFAGIETLTLVKPKRGPRFVSCPACLSKLRRRSLRGVLDVPWQERLREFHHVTARDP